MKKKLFSCLCLVALCSFALSAATDSERKVNARRVYGTICIVKSGADFDVKVVKKGEDLRVKIVKDYANSPGRWRIVKANEFPDYRVRYVTSDEDLRVRFVNSGEGPVD